MEVTLALEEAALVLLKVKIQILVIIKQRSTITCWDKDERLVGKQWKGQVVSLLTRPFSEFACTFLFRACKYLPLTLDIKAHV